MGLIAKVLSTGERVDIRNIDNPRECIKKGDVVCVGCNNPLMIKAGLIRAKHFAHFPDKECEYTFNPESEEHLFFKDYLLRRIPIEFNDYKESVGFLEYPIHEIKRIADICFEFKNGWRVVHEVQLSAITVEQIINRTIDYEKAGIDVVWWIGKNADTPAIREYLSGKFGEVLILDYKAVFQQVSI